MFSDMTFAAEKIPPLTIQTLLELKARFQRMTGKEQGRGESAGPVRVITNPHITKQEQYFPGRPKNPIPRAGKRRVQNKCRKKYMRTVPDLNSAYFFQGNLVVCHPALATNLRQALAGQELQDPVWGRSPLESMDGEAFLKRLKRIARLENIGRE